MKTECHEVKSSNQKSRIIGYVWDDVPKDLEEISCDTKSVAKVFIKLSMEDLLVRTVIAIWWHGIYKEQIGKPWNNLFLAISSTCQKHSKRNWRRLCSEWRIFLSSDIRLVKWISLYSKWKKKIQLFTTGFCKSLKLLLYDSNALLTANLVIWTY